MLKYQIFLIFSLILVFFTSGCSSIDKAESLYREGDKQAALEMAISLMDKDEDSYFIKYSLIIIIGMVLANFFYLFIDDFFFKQST